MKSGKYHLILAVVTTILWLPVLGRAYPQIIKSDLIGQPYPALVEIEKLHIIIAPSSINSSKNGLGWKQLQAKLESKLREAGIRIVPLKGIGLAEIPELRIGIDILKITDNQQYVFHIQTSLARAVRLAKEPTLLFKADVWKVNSTIQSVSVQDARERVTDVVLEQAEAFIHAYLAANPGSGQPADANNISAVPPRTLKPAIKSQLIQYKYVASKNSKVFHKPECPWAKRISPKNLVGYKTRDQAIKQGKRPCKLCKP